MKYIKTYEKYNDDYTGTQHFNYLDLEILDNGDLKIILNSEGEKEVEEEDINLDNFDHYFEDVRGNSEYMYWWDLGDAGLGMTNSPGITNAYWYDDNGNLVENESGGYIYWYPNYMIKDFTEELKTKGYVIFTNIEPRTEKQIKNIRLKKDLKKFNL